MNLQQLEYIVAVKEYKQFAKAAEACFVTQPTLSMMIQKFEEELGIKIFDRSKYPITTTAEGEEVVKRASQILQQIKQLKDYSLEVKSDLIGEVKMGIIPTLAPYLFPLFIKEFSDAFPKIQLSVKELMTDDLLQKLKNSDLDVAILAGPITDKTLQEYPLFKEPFLVYGSLKKQTNKKYLLPQHLNSENLWLLEEGHCFRNQVMNFCELRNNNELQSTVKYEAGSIETLINLVDLYNGITIIPQLAIKHLNKIQLKKVVEFAKPKPCRQISLIVKSDFPRIKLVRALITSLNKALPLQNEKQNFKIIDIK